MADNVRMDDATADTIRDELGEYEEAVQIARTLTDFRRGRHELEIGLNPLETPLPETQESRTAARLLSADAAIRAQDGDLDGAFDSCRAILGVGRSIGDEPFLISQTVRAAEGMVAMNSARRVLAQGEASDPPLSRLQSTLLDEQAQPLLVMGMKGERADLDELIRRIGTGEISLDHEFGRDISHYRGVVFPWGKLAFDNQRAIALEWTNHAMAIARQAAASRPANWKRWEANLIRVKGLPYSDITAALPVHMMPTVPSTDTTLTRYQATLGATAILLAAERHRLKTGDWPASIAWIDPEILPARPTDPFSGEPYRMERRDGRILIYSLGPNLKDDHGAFDRKLWMDGGPDDPGAVAWDIALRGRPADPAGVEVKASK